MTTLRILGCSKCPCLDPGDNSFPTCRLADALDREPPFDGRGLDRPPYDVPADCPLRTTTLEVRDA